METGNAASNWEDVENHVNLKRPCLPEPTHRGTGKNPKLEDSEAGALLNIPLYISETGIEIDPHSVATGTNMYICFFNQHSSLVDGTNESALLCTE